MRAADSAGREEIADDALVIERGEDRGIRPSARDVCKNAFGAAALVQIIVNERNVHDRLRTRI